MSMKVSYDCEELIEELKEDIEEFGEDEEMYAFFEVICGHTFLTNYDFITEEEQLRPEEVSEATVQIMKAKDILKILEEQNKII